MAKLKDTTIYNILTLVPIPTADRPSSPAEGTIYADSDDSCLKIYIGTAWYNIDMTAE